jgi:hypothetical protein
LNTIGRSLIHFVVTMPIPVACQLHYQGQPCTNRIEVELVDNFTTVALPIISAVSGLGGVFLGAWLSSRNEQRKRRLDFVEKQLQELYSPPLSIRKQVRTLSELRVRIGTEAGGVWQELCAEAREHGGPTALTKLSAERSADFDAITHYENEQWRNELLPSYKQMLQIFREKFWLAENSTREQFQKLIVYIELWERALNKTIPGEVVARLSVREAELVPLYDDLEQTFDKLRAKLS